MSLASVTDVEAISPALGGGTARLMSDTLLPQADVVRELEGVFLRFPSSFAPLTLIRFSISEEHLKLLEVLCAESTQRRYDTL